MEELESSNNIHHTVRLAVMEFSRPSCVLSLWQEHSLPI